MNLANMIFDLETVKWLILSAIGIYAWVIGRQSASSTEMQALRMRITAVEAQVKQMPSQEQLHQIALAVENVSGSVREVAARVEPAMRTMERVENYLLNSK